MKKLGLFLLLLTFQAFGQDNTTHGTYRTDANGCCITPSVILQQDTTGTKPINADNPLPITGTVSSSPSGTQDVNTTQVNGAAVNVGAGAASTGTQRVTTSTDSTIGTVTTVTNPVTVTDGAGSLNVIVDSSALPSGAATATLQGGGLPSALASDRLKVDGSGVTQPVSGTVTANSDGVADGVNVAASGAGAGVLTNTPVTTIGYAAVQVNISAFSATSVTPAASFDGGSTYATVWCRFLSSTTGVPTASISLVGIYECPAGDHFQLTQVGSGAVTAKITLKKSSAPAIPALLWGNGSATNAGSAMLVAGFDGTSVRRFVTDTTGNQGVYLASAATGGYSYSHIAAGQATTTVKSGAGTLHSICFNSAATTLNVTTVYDNTAGSGTVIAIPNSISASLTCMAYDIAFATGLTIVTATANGSDMTVSYK